MVHGVRVRVKVPERARSVGGAHRTSPTIATAPINAAPDAMTRGAAAPVIE